MQNLRGGQNLSFPTLLDSYRELLFKRLAAKITTKNAHLVTLSDEKSGTMLFKALKRGFCRKEGQQVLCQLTVKPKARVNSQLKFWAIFQLSAKILASCQLSVNPIQTLFT